MITRISGFMVVLGAGLAVAGPVSAQIVGTIDATITLEAGCIINGQNYDDGATGADFGTLDFGTQNTLFTQADAEVAGAGGNFTIQCSNGVAPILSFQAGENDGLGAGAGVRAMEHQTVPGEFVTYNLYSDAGRTILIPIGGDIPLAADGTVQTLSIYGRAFGEPELVPGTYGDVVTVEIAL